MTTIPLTIVISLVALGYCGHQVAKQHADSDAINLNNNAMALIAYIDNPDSSNKAIALLDKATAIDSNYFLGYYNKLIFLIQRKEFDKALLTINRLIRLRPFAHDLYLTGGTLYERIGDTVSSTIYFQKSLAICNIVLDTMQVNSRDYAMLVSNKAINLIMLGEQQQANGLLQQLYDSQSDEEQKKHIRSLMNKSKIELLQQFSEGD